MEVSEGRHKKAANASVGFAVASSVGWIIPIIGVPLSIAGIVFALKSGGKTRSGIALAVCILTLLAGGINAYVGAQKGAQFGKMLKQDISQQPERQSAQDACLKDAVKKRDTFVELGWSSWEEANATLANDQASCFKSSPV